jgi:hypothetical protein
VSRPSLPSRRQFLARAGSALAALALPPFPRRRDGELPLPTDDAASVAGNSLGRITTSRLNIHAAPDVGSDVVGYYTYDDVVTLYGSAEGPGQMVHNSLWFKVRDGYAYSSFVQPVERRFNQPLLPSYVSEERPTLLEVTMPYASAHTRPERTAYSVYRLYYATTHWAVAVERDEEKRSWYKLRNDRGHGIYYARAEWLRPILAEELAPISRGVPDKRVEINLSTQRLIAYEGEKLVLRTRVSTGAVFGGGRDFRTPAGSFRVWRKRPSRHMQGGTPGVDYFDLPGVPWVSYFTGGIALHGTYWHNDYGRVRSHGCVNLTPQDSRWLYRWTEPAVPSEEEILDVQAGAGTLVRVSY